MKYQLDSCLASSKKFAVNSLSGYSDDMKLNFKTLHVRVLNSELSRDLFYCTIGIPTIADDEGWKTELRANSDDDSSDNGIPHEELASNAKLSVQTVSEQGRTYPVLNLRISGTAYRSSFLLIDNVTGG